MDGSITAGSSVIAAPEASPGEVQPVVVVPEKPVQQHDTMTPEELVAKSIAPVRKEFLGPPPPLRPPNNTKSKSNGENEIENVGGCVETDDVKEAKGVSAPAPLVKEKKSKRQLKRERRQEMKSALRLCPEVAKSGRLDSCAYGDKCRFSHDLEAFHSLKPNDLEGNCPFLDDEGLCPYGLACRFAGTHKVNDKGDGVAGEDLNGRRKSSEVNTLDKDVQKLLWKNKMKFAKADATLKLLGLSGPSKTKKLAEKEEENGTAANGSHAVGENGCIEVASVSESKVECPPEVHGEDSLKDTVIADDVRPSKRAKSVAGDTPSEATNGPSIQEKQLETTTELTESTSSDGHVNMETDKSLKLHPREKKLIDFREKLYLAPLTTVGNLPFRRVCKVLGADITCGEMAMCTNLLQGQASEWALLRRHSSEDIFGVQICGAYPDTVAKTVELIEQECTVDFIDINMGCPIDIVVNKGAGSALLTKPMRMKGVIQAASGTVETPVTVKVRTGYFEGRNRIDSMIADIGTWGASAVTIHGRSRQQRYSKLADWNYIYQCARMAPESLQVSGNGDVFSYLDWNKHKSECPELSTCMIARGALIKPWLFTEIKEQRHWDISSGERLNILKDYVRFGLQHWGSDSKGVETTRHFLLEWLSYTYRYIPVGLLDVIPQRINWRSPAYFGRDDLETLMASDSAADWIRISEMLLGKVPAGFTFAPKHKSNAYDKAENG